MLSTAANSVWQSSTSTKGSGNWSQYNINITGAPYKFNVNTATTTTTSLSIHDANNFLGISLKAGDPILLSNNGTTFVSGAAGSLTTVAGAVQSASAAAFTTVGTTFPIVTNFGAGSIGTTTVSPDGRYAYASSLTTPYNITYWTLSTPFNFSTAVHSGKYWTPPEVATNTFNYSFTFKNDGTVIYVANTNTEKISAYPLTTAWDISTASTNPIGSVTVTLPPNTGYWNSTGNYGITCIRFSPDGTKIIIQNGIIGNQFTTGTGSPNGNFAIYTLSTPWNISTCATTTSNFSNANGNVYTNNNYSFVLPFIISPDGQTIVGFTGDNGSYSCQVNSYVYAFTFKLATPWTLNSGYTAVGGGAIANSVGNNLQIREIIASWDADGSTIWIQPSFRDGLNTWKSPSTLKNLWSKTNIDITSFGFATAPNVVYYAPPTLNVQTSNNASRMNMNPYEVYMNTASATTTTANLALYGSGVIAAGDTLLANGTTSITVSSVVESPLANVNMNFTAYEYYTTGKLKGVENAYTNFVLSPDGTTLITGETTPTRGLYMYKLSTPFDISTAVKTNIGISSNTASGFTNSNTVPFDISPDGKKLITCGDFIGSSPLFVGKIAVYQYTLTQAWNIGTAVFTGVFYNTNVVNASAYRAILVKWGPLGNSIIVGYSDDSSATTLGYRTLTVNYDLSTAANNGITSFTGAFGPSLHQAGGSVYFTPDGKKMLATAAGGSPVGLRAFPITSSNDVSTISSTATEAFALTTFGLGFAANNTYSGVSASPDGTKLYVIPYTSSSIYQFNVLLSNTTNYFVTYPTQSGKPSSMYLPDRSTSLALTMTRSGSNVTFASANTATSANNLAIKISSPVIGTNIANVLISTFNA
jgi:hypothetical protein